MEKQKMINSLNDSSNEGSKFATKNVTLWTVKQQKTHRTKIIPSNLRHKSLSQIFVIILMHLF